MTKINFPNGLEAIDNCAFRYSCLLSVELPETCLEFTGSSHFYYNKDLYEISLPHELTKIPVYFLRDCESLRKIDFPPSIESIDEWAFGNCRSLYKIEFPEGLLSIGHHSFVNCSNVRYLDFPSTLQIIDSGAFMNLSNLKAINCRAIVPPSCIGTQHVFQSGGNAATPQNVPVYIPVGTKEIYEKAEGWSFFTNFIETEDFTAALESVVEEDIDENNTKSYNMNGIEVKNPDERGIIVRGGRKYINQ